MNIVMLVKNSFEYDARVTKEACSLIEAGHKVTVVAIHVPGVTAEHEVRDDGIEVRRVSRVNLGVDALNRLVGRYAGTVEDRRARLTGEPVDEEVARELGSLGIDTTATPGAAVTLSVSSKPAPTSPTPPSSLRRAWGTASTELLRFVARFARFAFRVVKALLGRQGQGIKHYAINRRFIAAALGAEPDVVHCHDLNTLWAGTRIKRRFGCKLVYDSHELATARSRMTTGWRLWCEFWEKRGLPHADAVIMASPGYADTAVQKYGIQRPTVIINVPEPHAPTGTRRLRDELPIAADHTLLIYQGSIQENRGIEQVIDAVDMLEQVSLVVVGYGYHRPALESSVRKRGMTDRVHFYGPVPNNELVDWSSSADIGMCNIVGTSRSYQESLPNKLFEYVMAGIPVVVSNFGSMGRIVREEQVGETCDPADPRALAGAVQRMLDDPALYETYRSNTANMSAKYNWKVEEEHLLELYERMGT